jgi:uncharacterized membrane protein
MSEKFNIHFIRTTLVGGVLFLIPIVCVSYILGKAHRLMKTAAAPLDKWIPLDHLFGVALVDILAVLLMIISCFLAGLLARGPRAQKVSSTIDEKLLMAIPAYAFLKGFAGSMSDLDDVLKPVMVKLDDSAQIGLEVERKVGGLVAVYLPGSPSPWSGSLVYATEDRVDPLNLTVPQTFKLLRVMGRGSGDILSMGPYGHGHGMAK